MRRLNRPSWEALNLTPPPQLGRKDCISACAEQNALMRLKEASNVARCIPLGHEDAVYAVIQERSHFVDRSTGNIIPATTYGYYVSSGGTYPLEFHTATIDERLLWSPVSGKNRDNLFWPGSQFDGVSSANFLRVRDSYFVLDDDKIHVSLGTGDMQRFPEAGLRFYDASPLVSFPLKTMPRVRRFGISTAALHTTALPCLYCTKAIVDNKVRTTFIESKFEGLKGDDGLSLEYLATVNPGHVKFC